MKHEPRQMTWDMVEEEESTQRWLTCEHSSLLFLSGKNWVDVCGTTFSWLSYIAVFVAERLRREKSHVVYYCCQVEYTLTARKRRSLQQLVASLSYQLAALRPEMLRERTEEIRSVVGGDAWRSSDIGEALPAISNLFLDLLTAFEEHETVTLVIDRIDQCCWSSGCDDDGSALPEALESLLNIAKKAKCVVKVLIITCSTSSCTLTKWDRKELRKQGKERYIEKLNWDQESEMTGSSV